MSLEAEEKSGSVTSVKANEFRHIPADGIKVSVTDHGVKLIFAIEEDGGFLELVGVHLSHHSAALLRNSLIEGIASFEKFAERIVEPKLETPGDDSSLL